jgi:hypothetical protein
MSLARQSIASLPVDEVVEPCPRTIHRRRRSLPRGLTARSRVRTARSRKFLSLRRPPPPALEILAHHDYGDGRHALEFEGPALDMMLYHDGGVTIAEWVTVDGALVSMIVVGEC